MILFVLSFATFGLFYEFAACVFSGLYGFKLLSIWKKEKLKFYWNIETVTISLIVILYLISGTYGVDYGMSLIGFFKMLMVLFFLCYIMQMTEEKREKMMDSIPIMGCIMTILGFFAYGIEPLQKLFLLVGRVGGTFQYPNVFALFCLLGLIQLLGCKKTQKGQALHILQMLLLIFGIFLSGSRTVFFIFLFVCLLWCIREKKYRMPLFFSIAGILVVGIIYTRITGDFHNIGRFLTTSLTASEFLGRILYVKDGLRLLWQHPFGLGYLGYYFMEPAVQTGVYGIRFAHNDFLQMALDIGIIPCILFILVLIKNICDKENPFQTRISLLVIALHCLVDFDLEFTSMWLLVLLLLKWEYGKIITIRKNEGIWKCLVLLLSVTGIYMGAAMLPRQFGYAEVTAKLLPIDTEAKVDCIKIETDMEKALNYAQNVVMQNAYIPAAYDVLAIAEFQKGDYPAMAEYKMKSLKIQKYDIATYERHIVLLRKAIESAETASDADMEAKMRKQVILVERFLEKTKEETDELAYRINDKPNFELSEEVQKYVSQVKRVIED